MRWNLTDIAHIVVVGLVDNPQAWLDGVGSPWSPPGLEDMSAAFKNNFIHVFGDRIKHHPCDASIVTPRNTYRAIQIASFAVRQTMAEIPIRYNAYSIITVTVPEEIKTLRQVEQDIIASITPPATSWKLTERDPLAISTMFPFPQVTNLVEQSRTVDGKPRIAVDVRAFSPIDENTVCAASIQAFYTMAGTCLVEIEHIQSAIHIGHGDKKLIIEAEDEILHVRAMLANIKRRFFSNSQTYNPRRREYCETISESYRLRQRMDWHNDLNDDFEKVLSIHATHIQELSSKKTARILFILTAFTVASGLFFGLFTMNSETDIIRNGMGGVITFKVVPPLLFAIGCLLITILATLYWPLDRKK
jgi:hypothetical protein